MALYEVGADGLRRREIAKFAALGWYERADLQRLLRDCPTALGEDLLIIGEEFGQWEDARRRIDLLAVDRGGHLVVVELKRTEDGGHMELQALRYAAMVSSMGYEEVEAAYIAHCATQGSPVSDPQAELLAFLAGNEDDGPPVISADVRIILVSANFGREITTAVLWLNRFDRMDIRCVRLVLYEIDGKVLLDIQQVVPLPEAADYQVRIRRKDAALERAAATDGRDFSRYHIVVDGNELPDENKRNAARVMISSLAGRGVPLPKIAALLPDRVLRPVPGQVTGDAAVRDVLLRTYPGADLRRFFTSHPLPDPVTGQTYVLSKMWGRNTEATLAVLSNAFPDAKVTFRRADTSD